MKSYKAIFEELMNESSKRDVFAAMKSLPNKEWNTFISNISSELSTLGEMVPTDVLNKSISKVINRK